MYAGLIVTVCFPSFWVTLPSVVRPEFHPSGISDLHARAVADAMMLMWEFGDYSPLLRHLRSELPRERGRLAELEGRVDLADLTSSMELRIAPEFAHLDRIDQINVLNHELKHALDFLNMRLQMSLMSLPAHCRHAIMEIRAVHFAQKQSSWVHASPGRKLSEERLFHESLRVLTTWWQGNSPLGELALCDLVDDYRSQGIHKPKIHAWIWLTHRKRELMHTLLELV
ncbi:MAG: hypothetical protein KDC35_12245 [Acidobacteria bacterium]|nr:hypothetical protein [Acidobacteriota bacterium]